MQVLKNVVRSGQMVSRLGGQYRTNYIATAPRNKVSITEKFCHGVAIFIGLLGTPAYIALHINDYRERTN